MISRAVFKSPVHRNLNTLCMRLSRPYDSHTERGGFQNEAAVYIHMYIYVYIYKRSWQVYTRRRAARGRSGGRRTKGEDEKKDSITASRRDTYDQATGRTLVRRVEGDDKGRARRGEGKWKRRTTRHDKNRDESDIRQTRPFNLFARGLSHLFQRARGYFVPCEFSAFYAKIPSHRTRQRGRRACCRKTLEVRKWTTGRCTLYSGANGEVTCT